MSKYKAKLLLSDVDTGRTYDCNVCNPNHDVTTVTVFIGNAVTLHLSWSDAMELSEHLHGAAVEAAWCESQTYEG